MKQQCKVVIIPWRFNLLVGILIVIVLSLISRLIYLAVFKHEFLQTQGDARSLRIVKEQAFRGMITDRDGFPLAITTSIYALWMNPQVFSGDSSQIKALSSVLSMHPSFVKKMYNRYKHSKREFIYLKRDISPECAKKISALKIPGIYLQESVRRYYPEGEVAAHIVGFTNIDDEGQEGIELAFNTWLSGTAGKKIVLKDRLGRTIEDVQRLQEKKPGHHLILSINHKLQYLSYRELMTAIKENNAESGSVVVLDIKSGEILALANLPSFNPNKRAELNPAFFRNRALTDVFEPGSTIKTFSIASGLDSGQYNSKTLIQTHPGWIKVGHNIVQDEHNYGLLTVSEILQLSSNVGVTKIILSLKPEALWDTLHRVGFGEITGIGFPGERAGELFRSQIRDPFTLATLAFGYGLSVTPLQLAQAYTIIANQGKRIPLSLLKVMHNPKGTSVLKPEVAADMLRLLEAVVSSPVGTGKYANVPGYRVAGKTGTARLVGKTGYDKKHHIASFVGIAPVSAPRFVVAVVVRDPLGKNYQGGPVSGPVFSKIMGAALHLFNVPPDKKEVKKA